MALERRRILTLYCDQDPLLRSFREDLIAWFRQHGRGLGPSGASEVLYCLGRIMAEYVREE